MPKYVIRCPIEAARGHQWWEVEASDPKDALAKHEAGKSDFVDEEVEVTGLGKPEIEESNS